MEILVESTKSWLGHPGRHRTLSQPTKLTQQLIDVDVDDFILESKIRTSRTLGSPRQLLTLKMTASIRQNPAVYILLNYLICIVLIVIGIIGSSLNHLIFFNSFSIDPPDLGGSYYCWSCTTTDSLWTRAGFETFDGLVNCQNW